MMVFVLTETEDTREEVVRYIPEERVLPQKHTVLRPLEAVELHTSGEVIFTQAATNALNALEH